MSGFYAAPLVTHFDDFGLLLKLVSLVMLPAVLGMKLGRKASA